MVNTKKIILPIFFLFVILSFVSALEVKKTEIVVSTDPYQNMSVVVNDEKGSELQVFTGRARKFGEYKVTYYGVVSKIKITVSILENNETTEALVSKEFGPYNPGAPLNLTLKYLDSGKKEESEPLTISTNQTNSTVINITNVSSSPLTGMAIGASFEEVIDNISSVYYYVAIGLFGLGIFAFVMRRRLSVKKKSVPKEPDHQKMFNKKEEKVPAKEEFTPPASDSVVAPEKSNVQDLQQKIADLQKQLEQVRGEEKLIRLQRQLAREQQELKKLNNPSEQKSELPQKSVSPDISSLDSSKI